MPGIEKTDGRPLSKAKQKMYFTEIQTFKQSTSPSKNVTKPEKIE